MRQAQARIERKEKGNRACVWDVCLEGTVDEVNDRKKKRGRRLGSVQITVEEDRRNHLQ